MRVLFGGPLKDFSGFAHASRNFLKLLQSSDFEISARSITYDRLDDGQRPDYGDKLEKALKGPISGIDLFIQMTTCNQEAEPAPGVCNALYTFIESDRLNPQWVQKANTFDFLMVPSVANAEAFARSGVIKPILVAPPSCDVQDYTAPYEPFDIPNAENRTVFYNICQLSSKKGIDVLLRSYYAAFADMPDDVLLVLKTYVNMGDRSKDKEMISQFINRVWQGCRIPVEKRPPVLPIIQTLTDDEIHGLHKRGDAYVCTSRAEGWCLPVFDALAHGKTAITHRGPSLADFVQDEFALCYQGLPGLFYEVGHADPTLFTGVETCFEPSAAQVAHLMRTFHLLKKGNDEGVLNEQSQKEWQKVLDKRKAATIVGEKFHYGAVSEKVCEQLRAAHESWKETGSVVFNKEAEGVVAV
jgi:glycosyltransferase involved in cell wall biosynthesis